MCLLVEDARTRKEYDLLKATRENEIIYELRSGLSMCDFLFDLSGHPFILLIYLSGRSSRARASNYAFISITNCHETKSSLNSPLRPMSSSRIVLSPTETQEVITLFLLCSHIADTYLKMSLSMAMAGR